MEQEHTIEEWARIIATRIHPRRDTEYEQSVGRECERQFREKLKYAVFEGSIPLIDPVGRSPFTGPSLRVAFRPDGLIQESDLNAWIHASGFRLSEGVWRPFEISEGEKFIEAWMIPAWIADTVQPFPKIPDTSEALVAKVEKKIQQPEPNHYRLEELTDADVDFLSKIWQVVPNFKWPAGNVTMSEFAQYRKVFDSIPNKPAWDIQVHFRDFLGEQRSKYYSVRQQHYRQLDDAIRNGKVRALTRDRLNASKLESAAVIPVEDARLYLAGLGFELLMVPSPNPAGASVPPSSDAATPNQTDMGTAGTNKHLPKLERQKLAILQWLKENDYTPHSLPDRAPGKPGVKSMVKSAMLQNAALFTEASFEKAWESLRGSGSVKGG